MTQERVAKVALQTPPPPDPEEKRRKEAEARKLAEAARKRMEKEAAESKRAAKQEGRIGREDAVAKETVIPKGREDILRAKVARTGVLAVLGNQRRPGSGLAKLFDTSDKSDVEQAMNGLVGVELTAGRGAGGLGNIGSGPGGGGTSFGRIQGSGNLDVGAGRGRGRKGPSLGKGREREVQVGMETGTARRRGRPDPGADQPGGEGPRLRHPLLLREGAAAAAVAVGQGRAVLGDQAQRHRRPHQGRHLHAGQPGGRGLHGAAGAQLAVPALGQRDHRPELSLLLHGGPNEPATLALSMVLAGACSANEPMYFPPMAPLESGGGAMAGAAAVTLAVPFRTPSDEDRAALDAEGQQLGQHAALAARRIGWRCRCCTPSPTWATARGRRRLEVDGASEFASYDAGALRAAAMMANQRGRRGGGCWR